MRSRFALTLLASFALASPGCLVVDGNGRPPHHHHHAGPPPHAPAHGYRHKYHGHDLVFDSELGVYVVVGLRDVWFLDGSYFRVIGDHFEIGVGVDGPWRSTERSSVPARLYQKRHPHGGPPGQHKSKGKH
jgi:hypothetical protein